MAKKKCWDLRQQWLATGAIDMVNNGQRVQKLSAEVCTRLSGERCITGHFLEACKPKICITPDKWPILRPIKAVCFFSGKINKSALPSGFIITWQHWPSPTWQVSSISSTRLER